MSASILIIDDHPIVRDGISKSLMAAGFGPIYEAASTQEAIAAVAHRNPDVITVDINLPDGSGLEVISWARRNSSTLRIIVLTLNDELNLIAAAAQAGAQAFISKSAPASELVSAIEHVIAHPTKFYSNQSVALIGRERAEKLLTARELTVLKYLSGELSIAKIAAAMFISHATAKTHISAIYRKLESHSRQSAVAKARSIGLL